LLTDIVMPDVSGQELARRAVAGQPDLQIIFTSGIQLVDDDNLPFDWSALRKPYTLGQLRDALRLADDPQGGPQDMGQSRVVRDTG
jgi:CheY-like chemotaxis protein